MSQENKNLENRVKKAIEATGLPTEITATKVLIDNGWYVKNEFPYVNTENKRVRTLDITAKKFVFKNPNELLKLPWDKPKDAINCNLFIECKKSLRPWVFCLDTLTNAKAFFKFDRFVRNMRSCHKPEKTNFILTLIPDEYKNINYKIALSHQVAFINTDTADKQMDGGRDEIYTAEMQIFKALDYQEQNEDEYDLFKNNIVIPIILLNGNMFGCYYENQTLMTPKINFVRHLAHGLPNQKIPALIDIMTLDYFPTYISSITKELFPITK